MFYCHKRTSSYLIFFSQFVVSRCSSSVSMKPLSLWIWNIVILVHLPYSLLILCKFLKLPIEEILFATMWHRAREWCQCHIYVINQLDYTMWWMREEKRDLQANNEQFREDLRGIQGLLDHATQQLQPQENIRHQELAIILWVVNYNTRDIREPLQHERNPPVHQQNPLVSIEYVQARSLSANQGRTNFYPPCPRHQQAE